MPDRPSGLDNGLTNYGDRDFARYLRRSFAKSMGYTDKSLDKPIVGIASLIEGLQTARKQKNELALVAVSQKARRVLELARLDKVFTIHNDLSSALQPAPKS